MDDLTRDRDKVLRDNTAQTVHKYLESVTNNRQEYARRWIWELLQNARDAAKNHPATVHATDDNDTLTFQHDGAPFGGEEIAHLIYYGSSKHDPTASDPVGRFGSGFLITHVLAKNITVTGLRQPNDDVPLEQFRFTLTRDGNNATQMSKSMDDSWEAFNNSRTTKTDAQGRYTTSYEYPLSANAKPLARIGLATLDTLAPYALAFNAKLRELIITQDGTTRHTGVPPDAIPTTIAPGITKTPIRTQYDGTTREQDLITATSEHVSIAIITETTDGKTSITPPDGCPRLFIAFPLFGTEDFCFPVIINSEQFRPQEKRDSIFLGKDDTEYVTHNKKLITTACSLYQQLLTIASSQAWDGLHHLALLPPLNTYNWLDSDWYNAQLRNNVIPAARCSNILRTTGGTYLPPAQGRLPLPGYGYETADLWDLTSPLASINHTLPQRQDTNGWATVLERWGSITNQAPDKFPESWTIEKLASHVAQRETISSLQADLGGSDAIDWLTALYRIIAQPQHATLFDKLRLLPDQHGTLQVRSKLHRDPGISDTLKDIATTLRVPVREILLDQRIDPTVIPALSEKTENEVTGLLLDSIKKKPEEHANNPEYQDANTRLFAWLLHTGQRDMLEGYPVFSRHHDEERHTILRLIAQHNDPELTPLSPPILWPAAARPFLDLFPERHIIGDAYHDAHPDSAAWDALARAGYVRTDPVFENNGQDNELLPVKPLPDTDEQKHRIMGEATSTRISFLNLKNNGIIDRARNSRNRARQLIHFLTEYATRTNTFEHITIPCECGTPHEYYHAAWLVPLAKRSWVPIGERQHALITTETIAGLLHEETAYLRELAIKQAPFLQSIGINGSDLLLRTGTSSEAERVELVASALDLNDALGNNPAKLAAIAKALKDDPAVLEDIRDAAARRNKVRRNQGVGKVVEETLRALLEGSGLIVTRKHIGHDFEVETDIVDFSTLEPEEYGWEIANKKTSFLLEVKASTEEHYRMTPKQAETAVSNGLRFVLCMVNLPSGDNISSDDVKNGARFVPAIGQDLSGLYQELAHLETMTAAVPKADGEIELEIQDAQARFKIGKELWETGLTFDEAITFFQQRIDNDGTT